MMSAPHFMLFFGATPMSKWTRVSDVGRREDETRILLRSPRLLREIYTTFVDATPVVGEAQMLCEIFRLVDGGKAAGGLQGRARGR
jgi:hypothetical protein